MYGTMKRGRDVNFIHVGAVGSRLYRRGSLVRVPIDGPALRRVREWQSVTVTDLAKAVGLTPAGLCHVELGRRQSVTSEVFFALVAALDIRERPDWIRPAPEANIPAPRQSMDSGLPSGITSGIIRGGQTRNTNGRAAA